MVSCRNQVLFYPIDSSYSNDIKTIFDCRKREDSEPFIIKDGKNRKKGESNSTLSLIFIIRNIQSKI